MKKPIPVTLDNFEESAKQEADGCWNYIIKGEWFEVIWYGSNGPSEGYFKYIWRNTVIDREAAKALLKDK